MRRYYLSVWVREHPNRNNALAPAGIFSGGGIEVHQRRACKRGRREGGLGAKPPDAGEVFPNFLNIDEKAIIYRQNI